MEPKRRGGAGAPSSSTTTGYVKDLVIRGTVSVAFFFKDPAPTEIYTLSLHDALPISSNFLFFLQVCQCARDPENAVAGAQGQLQSFTGLFEPVAISLVQHAVVVQAIDSQLTVAAVQIGRAHV